MTESENAAFDLDSHTFQQTGAAHIRESSGNQDVVLCRSGCNLRIFAIADGQSRKTLSPMGGSAVLRAISDFIEEKGLDALASYEYLDELQYEIMALIRSTLRRLAAQCAADVQEFASTLVMLAIDPASGRYMTLHLGDGVIISVRQDGEAGFLSIPENGITSRYTWLTTSDNALLHLRISFGNIGGFSRILLASDGAGCICYGKNIPRRSRELIASAGWNEITGYMQENPPEDDASLILIDVAGPESGHGCLFP